MSEPGTRKDAVLNRERIIRAAIEAFSAGGGPPALETVARAAGVGIATLYRNFPTREDLVEAVYRSELGRLCDDAAELLGTQRPDAALRAWMGLYSDFVTTKREMADVLRAVIASGTITSAQTRQALSGAIQTLLDAGVLDGSLRSDVRAEDISASLAGVFLAAGAPEQREQAARMLDLLVDGIRAPR